MTDRQMIFLGSVVGSACTVLGALVLARVIDWARFLGVIEVVVGLAMIGGVASLHWRREA